MIQNTTDNHHFYLAPIRGVTDALFRTVFHRHFPYFDEAVAPFINPQRSANFKDSYLRDVFFEENTLLPVTPQLLYNNKEDFVSLSKRLEDMGHTRINWNLGCPAPQVANKKRGSGLLPYPDRICELLDYALPQLQARLTIKMRLGFKSPTEIEHLLLKFNDFDLHEIIIHPRIGKQLYKGTVNLEGFEKCRSLSSHTLVYNGDITTTDFFHTLKNRFPEIKQWMIGRGALSTPFLLAEIKGLSFSEDEKKRQVLEFHDDIYLQIKDKLSGPGHLLSRMKQIWTYMIHSFPGQEKILKKIRKASAEKKYLEAVDELKEF